MEWINVKDQLPPLDTQVVICYRQDHFWQSTLIHERSIPLCDWAHEIYWIHHPKISIDNVKD